MLIHVVYFIASPISPTDLYSRATSSPSPRAESSHDLHPRPTDNESSGSDDSAHQRFFTGHVTSVTEESGMVNEHVFFDMGVVVGGVRVEVGDLLHVHAHRNHIKAGWKAVRYIVALMYMVALR